MIRKAEREDADSVRELVLASSLFKFEEVEEVLGVYEQFAAGGLEEGHEWVLYDGSEGPVGIAYFAPEALSNGVWNLYFIAVLPGSKGQGIGKELVRYVEEQAIRADGRLLIVETSSLDEFERTRKFYRQCGFEVAGRIRDYYSKGEAKVIFLKDLTD